MPYTSPGFKVWMGISTGISIGLSLLLIAGGVGLLKRRLWSVRLCRTWAYIFLVFSAISLVVQIGTMKTQFAAISRQQGSAPGAFEGMMWFSIGFGLCAGLVWSLALPIFLLIWFSRDKIKAEVATWNASGSGPTDTSSS